MHLFHLLQSCDATITPARCKLHLACWNGSEDPLDVYFAGGFEAWQASQTKKNFGRELVVSLIALPEPNRWLFAGVHRVLDVEQLPNTQFRYSTARCKVASEFDGRLVIAFRRSGRQSYLRAERWAADLVVAELRAEPLQFEAFPGYAKILLTHQQLCIVTDQQPPSWKAALSSVSGVYVISDRSSGKLYVGSAVGIEGIWGRWHEYAKTGHGGNRDLRDLLRAEGKGHAINFQYGVLETADTRASEGDILQRESHWKKLLLSRDHGYNAN